MSEKPYIPRLTPDLLAPDASYDLLRQHVALLERDRWIPVSERLPQVLQKVEFYVASWVGCEYKIGYLLFDGDWHAEGRDKPIPQKDVTYWRPLPAPPAQDPVSEQPAPGCRLCGGMNGLHWPHCLALAGESL